MFSYSVFSCHFNLPYPHQTKTEMLPLYLHRHQKAHKNSCVQIFASLYYLLDFQQTRSGGFLKLCPSTSSLLNITQDCRQERKSCLPAKRLLQRTQGRPQDCYRLMSPCYRKILLHAQPPSKASFLMLCSLFSAGQLD